MSGAGFEGREVLSPRRNDDCSSVVGLFATETFGFAIAGCPFIPNIHIPPFSTTGFSGPYHQQNKARPGCLLCRKCFGGDELVGPQGPPIQEPFLLLFFLLLGLSSSLRPACHFLKQEGPCAPSVPQTLKKLILPLLPGLLHEPERELRPPCRGVFGPTTSPVRDLFPPDLAICRMTKFPPWAGHFFGAGVTYHNRHEILGCACRSAKAYPAIWSPPSVPPST